MQLQASRSKPVLPNYAPGAKSIEVPFTGPVLREEAIGDIPSDGFGVTMIEPSLNGTEDVVRWQPVVEPNGQPKMAEQVAQLDLRPYSVFGKALKGGAVGAAIGGGLGAVVGYFSGNWSLAAGIGAGTGATVGAAYAGHRVAGDTTSLDWQLTPVVRHHLDGYDHNALPQVTNISTGKNSSVPVTTGYWHTYTARVSQQQVGDAEYWKPVVLHSSDRK